MMGDSTRVEVPGQTPSERVINDSFDKDFCDAPGVILLATFASADTRARASLGYPAQRYERVCRFLLVVDQ